MKKHVNLHLYNYTSQHHFVKTGFRDCLSLHPKLINKTKAEKGSTLQFRLIFKHKVVVFQ